MGLDFDLLVLGGTLEGCAAAAAASDAGLRVALTERSGSLGGLATNGLYSYFPAPSATAAGRAAALRSELGRGLGLADSAAPTVYREQRLKVALAELLAKRKVTALTHVFPSAPILTDGGLAGFIVSGKTGDMSISASWVIDATGYLETAGYLGYTVKPVGRPARLGVKLNGADIAALATSARSKLRDDASQTIGILDFPFRASVGGVEVGADELLFLADKTCGEIIVHGLEAAPDSFDPLALSRVQASLRRGAYGLLEALRSKNAAFSKARIINVAPKMDLCGLRTPAGPSPYGNLVLCDWEGRGYDNDSAIRLGVEAWRKLTS